MAEVIHNIVEGEQHTIVEGEQHTIVEDDEQDQFIVDDTQDVENALEVSAWHTAEDFMKYILSAVQSLPQYNDSKYGILHTIVCGERLRDQMFETVVQGENNFSLEQLQQLDTIDSQITSKVEQLQACLVQDSNTDRVPVRNIKKASGKASRWEYVVDPFIASIVRLCINAKVQGGKNIEDTYSYLQTKYGLNQREKLQVLYVLSDSGYPIRSSLMDGEDMIQQYLG